MSKIAEARKVFRAINEGLIKIEQAPEQSQPIIQSLKFINEELEEHIINLIRKKDERTV